MITLSIMLLGLYACEKNDDEQTNPNNPTDGFTINGIFYDTPNCYIEFDDDNSPNEFNLFFLNGRMYDNQTNVNNSSGDYLFSTNMTNFVFYNIRALENPDIVIPQYPNIQTGKQYAGGASDSVIVHDGQVVSLSPPFTSNGFEFGMPDPDVGTIHYPGASGPFITINDYTYDSNTQTGSIDVDYQFTDMNGVNITGHYEGTLGVILD